MFKLVFENEKYRARIDKDTFRITVCPIISRSIYADEGEGIELFYAEWNDLVFVTRQTKKYLQGLFSKDIRKGHIKVHWLLDRLQLTIGEQFDDYFYPNAYIAFANFLEEANKKIADTHSLFFEGK